MDTQTDRYYIRETNGGRYCILNAANSLIVVNDITEADTFSKEEVSQHLKGRKLHFYEAVPVNPCKDNSCHESKDEEFVPASIAAANEASTLKNCWNGIIAQLDYLSNNADFYEDELNAQLVEVQEEICDIHHFMELKAETPEETKQAAEMLQGCLHRRREIKDTMLVLDILKKELLDLDLDERISSCKDQIRALDYRHYKPRQLPQLFSDNSCAS